MLSYMKRIALILCFVVSVHVVWRYRIGMYSSEPFDKDRTFQILSQNEDNQELHQETHTIQRTILSPLGQIQLNEKPRKSTENNGILDTKTQNRKNVIFLMADDMRPQLKPFMAERDSPYFSHNVLHTPNFDALMQKSIVFSRAYSQYSLCGPSRTSILTSRRPDVTRVFGNHVYWRDTGGNFTTLPQLFKENGYKTFGAGKIFHRGKSSNKNDPVSWSEPYYMGNYTDFYYDPPRLEAVGWRAVSRDERKHVPLTDDITVEKFIQQLRESAEKAKNGEQPFFFALGFRRPHVSFICPEEFFEYYPLERGTFMADKSWQTPNVRNPFGPTEEDRNGVRYIPADILKNLRRAYFACVSYVDHLVGEILRELEDLDLRDSTIVSFMADHGYHLGENNHFGKYLTSEAANLIPMMIHIPGRTDAGIVSHSLVEAVDIYPTIAEAAGLDQVPTCPHNSFDVKVCSDGSSLLQLIDKPNKKIKEAAYSQVLRMERFTMYSVRTTRFRFTEFAELIKEQSGNGTYNVRLNWNPPGFYTELYDNRRDPEERRNITADPKYILTKQNLQCLLHKQFTTVFGVR